jgi:hypothetical protein
VDLGSCFLELGPGCVPVPPEVQGKVIHKNFVRGVVIDVIRCYIIYRNRIKEQIMVLPEDSSKRVEKAHEEVEEDKPFSLQNIFGRPQEN